MTSANLLIVIIVGTIVGALVGLVFGSDTSGLGLVIVAGFLAVVAAAFVHNMLFARITKTERTTSGIPGLLIALAAVASLAGSMTAQEVTRELIHLRPSIVCALAGMISSALMGMLLVAYGLQPGKPRSP